MILSSVVVKIGNYSLPPSFSVSLTDIGGSGKHKVRVSLHSFFSERVLEKFQSSVLVTLLDLQDQGRHGASNEMINHAFTGGRVDGRKKHVPVSLLFTAL